MFRLFPYFQKCESFQAFSPPVSFADSPLVRGGLGDAKRSFMPIFMLCLHSVIRIRRKLWTDRNYML